MPDEKCRLGLNHGAELGRHLAFEETLVFEFFLREPLENSNRPRIGNIFHGLAKIGFRPLLGGESQDRCLLEGVSDDLRVDRRLSR